MQFKGIKVQVVEFESIYEVLFDGKKFRKLMYQEKKEKKEMRKMVKLENKNKAKKFFEIKEVIFVNEFRMMLGHLGDLRWKGTKL